MAERTQSIDDLAEAVESLTQQVVVLRQVIDELVTEVQWRSQNPGLGTSISTDASKAFRLIRQSGNSK